ISSSVGQGGGVSPVPLRSLPPESGGVLAGGPCAGRAGAGSEPAGLACMAASDRPRSEETGVTVSPDGRGDAFSAGAPGLVPSVIVATARELGPGDSGRFKLLAQVAPNPLHPAIERLLL